MRRLRLVALALVALSCGSPSSHPDDVVGTWRRMDEAPGMLQVDSLVLNADGTGFFRVHRYLTPSRIAHRPLRMVRDTTHAVLVNSTLRWHVQRTDLGRFLCTREGVETTDACVTLTVMPRVLLVIGAAEFERVGP